jgi:outer membrane lipoprotein-sorting protein
MKSIRRGRVMLVVATLMVVVAAQGLPATAQNASSAKFQDVKADIAVDLYTAVVQEHQTQTGTTAFRRAHGQMEMVTHLSAGSGGAATDLLFKNGELIYDQPAVKQETIFSAGANRGDFDTLLATGFGASGKDLASAWNVTFQGMEDVGRVQTAKLDLVSKQANIRNYFSHLTIWVDLSRDISLKQLMVQPDGDSRTVIYSNIRYNTHLPASLFTLHIASGTQVQRR